MRWAPLMALALLLTARGASADAPSDPKPWWLQAQQDAKGSEVPPDDETEREEPDEDLPPFGQGIRSEIAIGAVVDVIYDTPLYLAGLRVSLGRRINSSRWAVFSHFGYGGGQTDRGLETHFGAFGMTALYSLGVLRLGFGPEATYTAIVPFTHRADNFTGDHYGGIGFGNRFLVGADLLREEDSALFIEWRGGARLSFLPQESKVIWSPGSLWVGGRFGG